MTFQEQLVKMGACLEAQDWVGNKSLAEAWATCEVGQWMLWLAWRSGVNNLDIHMAATDCIDAAPVHGNVFANEGLAYARQLAAGSLLRGSEGYLAVYTALRSCWRVGAYPEDGYWPADDNGSYSHDRAALDRRFCDIIRERISLKYML